MAVSKEKLEKLLKFWKVDECRFGRDEPGFELSRHSPEGEEVFMALYGDTIEEMANVALATATDFDPDNHAAVIYHAEQYGSADDKRFYADAPDSLEDLLHDARWIKRAYLDVAKTLARSAKSSARKRAGK